MKGFLQERKLNILGQIDSLQQSLGLYSTAINPVEVNYCLKTPDDSLIIPWKIRVLAALDKDKHI